MRHIDTTASGRKTHTVLINNRGLVPVGALFLIIVIGAAIWFFKGSKPLQFPKLDSNSIQSPLKQPSSAGVEFTVERQSIEKQAEKYYRDRGSR